MERETPKTCLTNHKGSMSHHIMPLVINSLPLSKCLLPLFLNETLAFISDIFPCNLDKYCISLENVLCQGVILHTALSIGKLRTVI